MGENSEKEFDDHLRKGDKNQENSKKDISAGNSSNYTVKKAWRLLSCLFCLPLLFLVYHWCNIIKKMDDFSR